MSSDFIVKNVLEHLYFHFMQKEILFRISFCPEFLQIIKDKERRGKKMWKVSMGARLGTIRSIVNHNAKIGFLAHFNLVIPDTLTLMDYLCHENKVCRSYKSVS